MPKPTKKKIRYLEKKLVQKNLQINKILPKITPNTCRTSKGLQQENSEIIFKLFYEKMKKHSFKIIADQEKRKTLCCCCSSAQTKLTSTLALLISVQKHRPTRNHWYTPPAKWKDFVQKSRLGSKKKWIKQELSKSPKGVNQAIGQPLPLLNIIVTIHSVITNHKHCIIMISY